jgi:integrase/recombinase XerD
MAGGQAMNARELKCRLDEYLKVRSALGYRDYGLRNLLRDFVRYLVARHWHEPIRAGTAVDWACSTSDHNGASRLAYRLSVARGFLTHLRASEPDTEIPAVGLLRKSPRRIPYLFSKDEVVDLLKAASRISPENSLRPHTYETILGLMASTGIRVGEAIRLNAGDVKLDSHPPRLEIRESKFRKSRVVVLHPTTAEKLKFYVSARTRMGYGGNRSAFFLSERRKPLCYETLRSWFARTTRALGMVPPDNRRTPTLHGLRHYFAVERLTRWCEQGARVRELAPTLSVYLGHVSPEESYWYLTSTPALLRAAGESFQHYAVSGGAS